MYTNKNLHFYFNGYTRVTRLFAENQLIPNNYGLYKLGHKFNTGAIAELK